MHAVIMTSTPPLFYWLPATVQVIQSVIAWRKSGLPVCYTIDAGPNVHVICPAGPAEQIAIRLSHTHGVLRVMSAIRAVQLAGWLAKVELGAHSRRILLECSRANRHRYAIPA